MKICNDEYPNDEKNNELFDFWPFELSNFQKWAVTAIKNKFHTLVTAHTGCGKTLVAESAILRSKQLNKKLIYTSPIKALSNQKIREFSDKFPDISFGIITGDTNFNPDADVLIMTTEVLRNTLFQMKNIEKNPDMLEKTKLHFNIDIYNELGFVVFDEVHYINDPHRGHVWEETIMMLPHTVQMVMLSATINHPEKFANWIETQTQREIWLCPTNKRVVPLEHYSYFTIPESQLQKFPTNIKNEILDIREKPLTLKNTNGQFIDKNYHKTMKVIKELEKNNVRVNPFYAFNQLLRHLKEQNKLPAIAFVFSRKKAQQYAEKVDLSLFPENSKLSSTVEKEVKKILLKLPNYKEYLSLPEYTTMIKLLQKGIAVHHAGMPQVFREVIENLFDKKCIYLLCATETFALGLNMPTKSVIYPALQKFDGERFRVLLPHEYAQQAGRAGRRGLDKLGEIWLLQNSIQKINNHVELTECKIMMTGAPQTLTSKFQINFNIILGLISVEKLDFKEFIEKSMISHSIKKERDNVQSELVEKKEMFEKTNFMFKTNIDIIKKYDEILEKRKHVKTKKRKKLDREIIALEQENRDLITEYGKYLSKLKDENEIYELQQSIENIDSYITDEVKIIISLLLDHGFIEMTKEDNKISLTEKGLIANCIHELPALAIADVIYKNTLNNLSDIEFISVLSIFAPISIPDHQKVTGIEMISCSDLLKNKLKNIEQSINYYVDLKLNYKLYFNDDFRISWDMVELIELWCSAENEESAKFVYFKAREYEISLGEFTKCILKINNIASEIEKAALVYNNLELLEKVKKVPELTLKSIVTNQSLYL